MSLENNLKYAREAILHTHEVLPSGASNIPNSKFGTYLKVLCMRVDIELCRRIAHYFSPDQFTFQQQLKIIALRAKAYGVGNCEEQSIVAYDYLRYKKNLRKLDLLGLRGADHQFLLIGRADGSDITDPATWGDQAVICDPWGNRYFPAQYLDYHLNQIFNKYGYPSINSINKMIRYGYKAKPYHDVLDEWLYDETHNKKANRFERKQFAEQQLASQKFLQQNKLLRNNVEEYIATNSKKKQPPLLSEDNAETVSAQFTFFFQKNKDEARDIWVDVCTKHVPRP